MSGPNHVAGGTIFTGLYLSMWDINIYSNPMFIFFTAFFALLPDIDHTKSFIGKLFYPVAKYLDKKFGHRTITHSLLVYILLGLLIGIIEKTWLDTTVYTKIYYWAYGSHFILDMITLQGIPLFYPFKKNPCVLPANPNMRFRSSDLKAESIMLVIFISVGFMSKDLFANGFWNTYNTNFQTIKHINNERLLSDKTIEVHYNLVQENKQIQGKAILINSTESKALLFNPNSGFISISDDNKIFSLIPKRTNHNIQNHSLSFTNISFDSLQLLIKNKPILSLKLQSTLPINFTKENKPQSSQSIDLENIYNPILYSSNIDSLDIQVQKDLELNSLETQSNQEIQAIYHAERETKQAILNQTEIQKQSSDLSEREKGITNYPKAKTDLQNLTKPYDRSRELSLKRSYLLKKLHIHKTQSINGYIQYFTIK